MIRHLASAAVALLILNSIERRLSDIAGSASRIAWALDEIANPTDPGNGLASLRNMPWDRSTS